MGSLKADDAVSPQASCSGGGLQGEALMRLRGGASAVQGRSKGGVDLGRWKGRNVGPRRKHLMWQRVAQIPSEKAQARWVIDCTKPQGDRVIDVADVERWFKEQIKVQGKRGNLGPRKEGEAARVLVFREKETKVVIQSFIRMSKRYVKWLMKQYLYKQGMRDFQWVVTGARNSYKLKYYNFQDIKSTAAQESITITQEEGGDDEAEAEEGEGEGGGEEEDDDFDDEEEEGVV